MWLYKRGKFWWTKFEHCGEEVNRSTRVLAAGPESKARAQEVEDAERDRIIRARKIGDRSTATFREIAERWIATTKGADRSRLDWFLAQPDMDSMEIGQVNDEMVEEFERMLRAGVPGRVEQLRHDGSSYARERSDATVSRYMCVLRTILNYARKKGKLAHVPFVEVQRTDQVSKAKNALTEEEFERLYRELPEHLQNPLQFAVATGLRTGSVLSMTWDRIRPDGEQYYVPAKDLKGQLGDRGWPLNELAQDALRAARAYAPPGHLTDHIFQYRDPTLSSVTDMQMRAVARDLLARCGAVSQRDLRRALKKKFGHVGGTPRRQRICREETEVFVQRGNKVARINRSRTQTAPSLTTRPLLNLDGHAFQKAVERAGLGHKHVTPHTTRHTFATWLINRGVSDRDLMELGNWRTLAMMRHYAYLKGDSLAPAAAKIPTLNLEKKGALRLVTSGFRAADAEKNDTKTGTEE